MKNHRQKLLCTLLTAAMLLSLAACGSSASSPAPSEPAQEEAVENSEKDVQADAASGAQAGEKEAGEAAAGQDAVQAGETADAAVDAGTAAAPEDASAADKAADASEDAAAADKAAAAPEDSAAAGGTSAAADGSAIAYENKGFTLSIPEEYDGLLFTTTPEEDGSHTLFSCYEIASIEAAKAQGIEEEGPGWLFDIRTIDEASLHERLCYDMSGDQVFATDGNGTYFLLCHPTDVRLFREEDGYTDEAMAQWSELNEWGASVKDAFIRENEGLAAARFGNTMVDMSLAQIAYMDDVDYTLSTTQYGPLQPAGVDPSPYLEKLWKDVTFSYVDGEAPDGEYVVLNFPDIDTRFDFFISEEDGNYIRQVNGDDLEYAPLFRAEYADGSTNASKVMQEWYDAIAKANGK